MLFVERGHRGDVSEYNRVPRNICIVTCRSRVRSHVLRKVQNSSEQFHLIHILIAIRSDVHHPEHINFCGSDMAIWTTQLRSPANQSSDLGNSGEQPRPE